jgi:hypothetical protein
MIVALLAFVSRAMALIVVALAASRADTSRCADSRAARPPPGFVEATTNCETSSGPVLTATNTFLPITAGYTFPPRSLTALSIMQAA